MDTISNQTTAPTDIVAAAPVCQITGHANCDFATQRTAKHLLEHVRLKIPVVISAGEIKMLPRRSDFLDPTLQHQMLATIAATKPLIFLPIDVREPKMFEDYCVYMFGVLPDGRKARVKLTGIRPSFDIAIDAGYTPQEFTARWRNKLNAERINSEGITTVNQFTITKFSREPLPFIRLHFKNMQQRGKALRLVNEENANRRQDGKPEMELAGDDARYYFNKVARESRFKTADWNRIENYIIDPSGGPADILCLAVSLARPSVVDETVKDENDNVIDRYTSICERRYNFYRVTDERRKQYMSSPTLRAALDRDPSMTAMWDIETYREIQNGLVPTPADTDYTIFMMCTVFFWHHSTRPLLTVDCHLANAAVPRQGIDITIYCATERELFLADIEIKSRMRFDILGAFNGGCFDWPLYVEKLRREKLLGYFRWRLSLLTEHIANTQQPLETTDKIEASVRQWAFSSEKIKISAGLDHELDTIAQIPGWLDTDVMPTFLRLYTRMEVRKAASLNFFLAENKIEGKEDMPYKRMFRIYERSRALGRAAQHCHCVAPDSHTDCPVCRSSIPEIDDPLADPTNAGADEAGCCYCVKRPINLRHMADVSYYCVIDCIRPQQLYVARAITYDKRELSSLSYVSLFDSFYRADGMKVRNMIGSYCTRYNIAFPAGRSNKHDDEKIHYPGAHVFAPERGLTDRPLTGLDFSSLYPSLMMAYNLSPDMLVYTREEADKLEAAGYSLHQVGPVQCEQGREKGLATNQPVVVSAWTVRHNGVIDRRDTQTIAGWRRVEEHIDAAIGNANDQHREATIKVPTRVIAADGTVTELAPSQPSAKYEYENIPGREKLPGERMGIFSYIVKKIFEKRVPIKRRYVQLGKIIEAMKIAGENTREFEGQIMTVADLEFLRAKINATQSAIKILANTFYGETGNFRSPIYSVHVAAGVTSMGQVNIKLAYAFVSSLGYEIKYGDTDSLYIVGDWAHYADFRDSYNANIAAIAERKYSKEEAMAILAEPVRRPKYCIIDGINHPQELVELEVRRRQRLAARLTYWTAMVQKTLDIINDARDRVNEHLIISSGTRFLSMAYEEVGFPAVLCGKKKYFMTPHIGSVNFYVEDDDIFIKGIEIVKQGKSKLMKTIGMDVIRETLAPENERELFDITCGMIQYIHDTNWPLDMFQQMARYRPEKNNPPVLNFVDRMILMQKRYADAMTDNSKSAEARAEAQRLYAMYEPPEAGDKFEYVVCEKEQLWTPSGKKIIMTKGDHMEYVHVYKASQTTAAPLRIKLSSYMHGAVIGVLARFIAYAPQFQPISVKPYSELTGDEYDRLDAHCTKAAAKYLEQLNDQTSGVDRQEMRDVGTRHRKMYRIADALLRADLLARYGYIGAVLTNISVKYSGDWTNQRQTISGVLGFIDGVAEETWQPDIGEQLVARSRIPIADLYRWWCGGTMANKRYISRRRYYQAKVAAAKNAITDRLDKLMVIMNKYEREFVSFIGNVRANEALAAPSDDPEEISDLYVNNFSPEEIKTIRWFAEKLCEAIAARRCEMDMLDIGSAVASAWRRSQSTVADNAL